MSENRRWAVAIMGGFASIDANMELAPKAWWSSSFREEAVLIGAVSHTLAHFMSSYTIEAEVGVGHRFGVSGTEGWVAGYLRYDNFPWNHVLRTTVAASIGINYINRLPVSESYNPNRPQSRLLHYFSPEITLALPDRPHQEMVFRIHHRSGVHGLFYGVKGGADAFVMGLRHRF